jgi:hypothetical protein
MQRENLPEMRYARATSSIDCASGCSRPSLPSAPLASIWSVILLARAVPG